MKAERREAEIIPFPARPRSAPAVAGEGAIGDLRFRALIGELAWARLDPAIRRRFGKSVAGHASNLYAGEIVHCEMSRCGWLLAQAARLIGAPLPLSPDIDMPATVVVTEDPQGRGQYWTRLYGTRHGFPQVIRSRKSFCGPTGLEEYLGLGLGIALTVEAEAGALHFRGDHYFLRVAGRRLRIPRWLAPGRLVVSHIDCGQGRFAFKLVLRQRLLGLLICQVAMFADPPAEERP